MKETQHSPPSRASSKLMKCLLTAPCKALCRSLCWYVRRPSSIQDPKGFRDAIRLKGTFFPSRMSFFPTPPWNCFLERISGCPGILRQVWVSSFDSLGLGNPSTGETERVTPRALGAQGVSEFPSRQLDCLFSRYPTRCRSDKMKT